MLMAGNVYKKAETTTAEELKQITSLNDVITFAFSRCRPTVSADSTQRLTDGLILINVDKFILSRSRDIFASVEDGRQRKSTKKTVADFHGDSRAERSFA